MTSNVRIEDSLPKEKLSIEETGSLNGRLFKQLSEKADHRLKWALIALSISLIAMGIAGFAAYGVLRLDIFDHFQTARLGCLIGGTALGLTGTFSLGILADLIKKRSRAQHVVPVHLSPPQIDHKNGSSYDFDAIRTSIIKEISQELENDIVVYLNKINEKMEPRMLLESKLAFMGESNTKTFLEGILENKEIFSGEKYFNLEIAKEQAKEFSQTVENLDGELINYIDLVLNIPKFRKDPKTFVKEWGTEERALRYPVGKACLLFKSVLKII